MGLASFKMGDIGVGNSFYDALLGTLEQLPSELLPGDMQVWMLIQAAYWYCSLALSGNVPPDEVLAEEIGSEEALVAVGTVAWAIAKRLVNDESHCHQWLSHWTRRTALADAMRDMLGKCEDFKIHSVLPMTEHTRLVDARQEGLRGIRQQEKQTTIVQQINITAHNVTINNIHDNGSINI